MNSHTKTYVSRGPEGFWAQGFLSKWSLERKPPSWHMDVLPNLEDPQIPSFGSFRGNWLNHWLLVIGLKISSPSPLPDMGEWGWNFQPTNHMDGSCGNKPHPKAT